MANKISPKELKNLEILSYDQVRPQLKTGDLFFCSGQYGFSRAIQFFSKSAWSHVGIIYRDENLDRILFMESELVYGVRVAPLSNYIRNNNGRHKPYKGVIVIASVDGVNEEMMKQCIRFGMDELTRPYNNWEILRILMRMVFGIGRRQRGRRYICSEYVQACFRNAGVSMPSAKSIISPETIWENPIVKMKFRVL
jgi:hypothetical protein